MSYESALELLADPTRRSIVDHLRRGPAPVGAIADGLPVSRPAVSKHLRLMLDAGLLRMHSVGTRNLYELDLAELMHLRSYIEGFWDEPLTRFKEAAEKEEP